jgi:hypothetical protein
MPSSDVAIQRVKAALGMTWSRLHERSKPLEIARGLQWQTCQPRCADPHAIGPPSPLLM